VDSPGADVARKMVLIAKVQDEIGHAQLLYRVAEDLGRPRAAMIEDLLAGRAKFHDVFHYPAAGPEAIARCTPGKWRRL